jgi:hypothetical protein
MTKQLIGIVLATIAVFLWGFVYWGLLSVPTRLKRQWATRRVSALDTLTACT